MELKSLSRRSLVHTKALLERDLLSMESWTAAIKALSWWAVSPAPVRVPSQRPLAPSVASVTSSLMIRVIMKWSWGLCTDLLAFALQPRKTQKKTSARRPSNEDAVLPVITSNGVPLLQIRSVGSYSTLGREKEGKDGVTI